MSLSPREASQLQKLIKIAQALLASADNVSTKAEPASRKPENSKRLRRSGKELAAFQKLLKAERKRGVPVAEMARKHGISSAYIYMLK
jgi:hypothetical protein